MVIRHPRRFRVKSLVRQIELVGVSSLPIIGLMSFLVGITIAQQGAVQLQEFGAACDENVNPISASFFEKAKRLFR